MKSYEYKHFAVPLSDDQLMLIGIHLEPSQRAPLDIILEATLNDAGKEGWRVVSPLMLPYVLMEREING